MSDIASKIRDMEEDDRANFKIFILTKNRIGKQVTLKNLPPSLLSRTFLVCPKSEAEVHGHQTWYPPDEVTGVCKTRQWILDNAKAVFGVNKIFMLDDDLNFNIRIEGTTKLRKLKDPEELSLAFETLNTWLDTIPVVGMSTRQGNNTVQFSYADNTRILRFFGFNLHNVSARFDRQRVMEDFDFLLQMLRQGKPNRVLYTFTQDQPQSGSAGGCSDYRTAELQASCAHQLKASHPEFVTVTEKEVKKGWFEGGKRTDVIIYWKKAFASGSKK